ncbi:MAG: hypothetical protein AAB491_02240 [Patescibacteria group bacterium]
MSTPLEILRKNVIIRSESKLINKRRCTLSETEELAKALLRQKEHPEICSGCGKDMIISETGQPECNH